MRAIQILPNNYKEMFSVNLQKDKKTTFFVNAFAGVIMLAMAVPIHFYVPISTLFDMQNGIGAFAIRFIALAVLTVVYMILHELVHGITMKFCGTKKVKYGFTGLYAFAGSDDYYDKRSYIIIALAPVVIWGIVIAIVNTVVSRDWFWVIYFIQISNISGEAGDIYVTARFSRLPKDILIKDDGVGRTVYFKETL